MKNFGIEANRFTSVYYRVFPCGALFCFGFPFHIAKFINLRSQGVIEEHKGKG